MHCAYYADRLGNAMHYRALEEPSQLVYSTDWSNFCKWYPLAGNAGSPGTPAY